MEVQSRIDSLIEKNGEIVIYSEFGFMLDTVDGVEVLRAMTEDEVVKFLSENFDDEPQHGKFHGCGTAATLSSESGKVVLSCPFKCKHKGKPEICFVKSIGGGYVCRCAH